MPQDLVVAVKETARCGGITTSAMIQRAITYYLTMVAAPGFRKILDDLSTAADQLDTMNRLALIRAGITSCSEPGRLRGQCVKAAYMRYCRACNREGAHRKTYRQWQQTFDELSIVLPKLQLPKLTKLPKLTRVPTADRRRELSPTD